MRQPSTIWPLNTAYTAYLFLYSKAPKNIRAQIAKFLKRFKYRAPDTRNQGLLEKMVPRTLYMGCCGQQQINVFVLKQTDTRRFKKRVDRC